MQPDLTGVSLILPAYNEAKCIRSTIAEAGEYFEARRLPYEIIVAADGDDGTREIVAQRGFAASCQRSAVSVQLLKDLRPVCDYAKSPSSPASVCRES